MSRVTFLPIVGRELRVAARHSATYWRRFGGGLVAILLFVWIWRAFSDAASIASLGAWVFRGLTWLGCAYALLAGIRDTSDCLSSEKREGTLGLLFLTDLKGYDVVFGKLAATSLNTVYSLLAMLPVLSLPLLMGGITLKSFLRVAALLLNTLFFSLAAGMVVSVVSRDARKAASATCGLILFVTLGVPLLQILILAFLNVGVDSSIFFPLTPIYTCIYVFDFATTGAFPGSYFWWSLFSTHLLAWVCLGIACRAVRNVWRDRPATRRRERWREKFRRACWGDATQQAAFRAGLLEINPILWLSSRNRFRRGYPWMFLAAMALLWVWVLVQIEMQWFEPSYPVFLIYLMHAFLKQWVTTAACQAFSAERDQGALELLLSTPLTTRELIRGQVLALKRLFGAPVLTLFALETVWLLSAYLVAAEVEDFLAWILVFWASLLVFIPDILAAAVVGLWLGVASRNASKAISRTTGRVLALPWLCTLVAIFPARMFAPSGAMPFILLTVWFVSSLLCDFLFAQNAWRNLKYNLRQTASARYDPVRAGRRAKAGGEAGLVAHGRERS